MPRKCDKHHEVIESDFKDLFYITGDDRVREMRHRHYPEHMIKPAEYDEKVKTKDRYQQFHYVRNDKSDVQNRIILEKNEISLGTKIKNFFKM